jgi:chemotaxis family two-component system sensor kinase Cph1
MNAPEIAPDITACDLEPIHIPGSIQPHGLLLIADRHTLEIVAGAGDLGVRLTPNWLHHTLYEVLGQRIGEQLAEKPLPIIDRVQGQTEIFDVLPHASDTILIVELEPAASKTPTALEVLTTLRAANDVFEQALGLQDVCERAALAFRQLIDFDRVMIYRFRDDDAGVVIAEARGPDLGSFMNHHFPASDIPKQARALYVRNPIRVIPDVNYVPALIGPGPEWRSIDMSDTGLRSVSPIHIQYLKNMEVGASASVSIVKDGRLWGLIACHNRTPKRISYDVRMACLGLAGTLSHQIRIKESADIYRERGRLRSAEDSVVAQLGSDVSLDDFFSIASENLCRMLGADGFAVVRGEDIYVTGKCPDSDVVGKIARWVTDLSTAQPFSTHNLSKYYEPANAHQALASGLLAVTMLTEEPIILLWFRAEQVEIVNWAGNPHKGTVRDLNATLNPRSSFEAWSEAVRGHSRPWSLQEVDAANRLKRAMFEARQNRRLRQLNKELAATVADKENLLKQKDYLIKEVNHRVQNSLQLVSSFLGIQARTVDEPSLTEYLSEAQRRISAVALVHRRLYSDDQVETIDLARYLEDLCGDLKTSMGQAWGENFTFDLTPILTSADRAVNIGLILTELVINANKYAYSGAPGPIAIGLEQHGTSFRLTVADKGAGKVKSHKGFGTRMLIAMVSGLCGSMAERDTQPGLHVSITAPIEERRAAVR